MKKNEDAARVIKEYGNKISTKKKNILYICLSLKQSLPETQGKIWEQYLIKTL